MKDKPVLQPIGPFCGHAHHLGQGDHLVHFYHDVKTLIDSVCDYIVPGITRGDGIILIVSRSNHGSMTHALERRSIDVSKAQAIGQVQFLDSEETLSKFMVNDRPDRLKFFTHVGQVIKNMQVHFPMIRAFGEMVDTLWQRGHEEATKELEALWNELAEFHHFSLFCGYLAEDLDDMSEIHREHTHVVGPSGDFKVITR